MFPEYSKLAADDLFTFLFIVLHVYRRAGHDVSLEINSNEGKQITDALKDWTTMFCTFVNKYSISMITKDEMFRGTTDPMREIYTYETEFQ